MTGSGTTGLHTGRTLGDNWIWGTGTTGLHTGGHWETTGSGALEQLDFTQGDTGRLVGLGNWDNLTPLRRDSRSLLVQTSVSKGSGHSVGCSTDHVMARGKQRCLITAKSKVSRSQPGFFFWTFVIMTGLLAYYLLPDWNCCLWFEQMLD